MEGWPVSPFVGGLAGFLLLLAAAGSQPHAPQPWLALLALTVAALSVAELLLLAGKWRQWRWPLAAWMLTSLAFPLPLALLLLTLGRLVPLFVILFLRSGRGTVAPARFIGFPVVEAALVLAAGLMVAGAGRG